MEETIAVARNSTNIQPETILLHLLLTACFSSLAASTSATLLFFVHAWGPAAFTEHKCLVDLEL
jgi:hypothetical protein